MPASLATISAITKEIYEAPLRKQLNDEVVALSRIVKPTGSKAGIISTVGGKYVTFPVHYRRNSGIGARKENETLPSAGQQGTAAAQIGLRYQYGAIQLSGPVLALADSNEQVFLSALELETSRIREDLAVDLNRQVYGTGDGTIAATSSTTSIDTPVIESGWWNLQLDEVVDVVSKTALDAGTITTPATPKATGLTITALDEANQTCTLSSAVSFAAHDRIIRTGSANREWTGLGKMVSNASDTYQNIANATVGVWKSNVDGNSGTPRAISESIITKNVDYTYKVSGSNVSLLLTSLGVRRSYANLLTQQRSFVNKTEFTGGFGGLAFTTDRGDIPMIADKDCPVSTVYGLSEKNIKLYRDADWAFMDRDGNMWYRIPDKDGYGARLFQYSELATDRRNAHFMIQDITES